MTLDQIIQVIGQTARKQPHTIVAVSGYGGSGKTTLAGKLKEHFGDDATLLQLDNFLVDHGEGPGWAGGYDWDRFESVLQDIKAGKDLHYQWYNWHTDETKDWIDQPLPRIVIAEGVRLLQPKLLPYFDHTIWIDCPLEVATERGKARDRANKPSDGYDIEAHIRKWDEEWTPKEREFDSLFHPADQAELLWTQ
jgi:uridine kinase